MPDTARTVDRYDVRHGPGRPVEGYYHESVPFVGHRGLEGDDGMPSKSNIEKREEGFRRERRISLWREGCSVVRKCRDFGHHSSFVSTWRWSTSGRGEKTRAAINGRVTK